MCCGASLFAADLSFNAGWDLGFGLNYGLDFANYGWGLGLGLGYAGCKYII